MKLLKVRDEYLEFFKWRLNNSYICCILGAMQLLITCAALGQHIYSLLKYHQILKCQFNASKFNDPYLEMDIIIFDFGVFRKLWGIHQCIALYLDGGYMRFVWCIKHILAILSMIFIAKMKQPKSQALWPMLTVQSLYAIGLLILSISSLPKFLSSMFDHLEQELWLSMILYLIGAGTNFFLTYILWHYYWHLEANEKNPKPVPV